MQKITLRVGDILSKKDQMVNETSIGLTVEICGDCAIIKFDDEVDLLYSTNLTVDKSGKIKEYMYLGQPVYLIARGSK